MTRHIVPLFCVTIYLSIALLFSFNSLLISNRIRLWIVKLRIHHMLVSQELVVGIVNIKVTLFYLGLNLRCLTAGKFMIVCVICWSNCAHRLREWILLEDRRPSYEFLCTGNRLVSFLSRAERQLWISKLHILLWVVRRITSAREVVVFDRHFALLFAIYLILLFALLRSLKKLTFDKRLVKRLWEFLLPAAILRRICTLRSLRTR